MKERLRVLLSEVGESLDYLRSDVRNLSRYMAELEETDRELPSICRDCDSLNAWRSPDSPQAVEENAKSHGAATRPTAYIA